MAATAWEFYNSFKNSLGSGAIDLSGTGTSFSMRLYSSASNAATASLVTGGQLTNELTAGDNGYTIRPMTVNWSVKTTTSTYTWTFNTVVWTAPAGSALNNVKFAVIMTQTASILVCWSQLSTAEITVPAGTELHIAPNPVCFELS
jgi:hypothetical protein